MNAGTLLMRFRVLTSVLLGCVAGAAQAGVPINNDACFAGKGQPGIAACADLAEAIGPDLYRLNAHGRILEEDGRHDAALLMYRSATAAFPHDKRALQGLVRARANARAARIILDLAPQPTDISPCWTTRWMQALEACTQESTQYPEDARLQERLGDVARSVGDVQTANAAYARSLELAPENDNLHRKRDALVQLMAGSSAPPPAPVVAEQPAATLAAGSEAQPVENPAAEPAIQPVRQAQQPEPADKGDVAANSETVRRLELLEILREKGLVDAREYAARRSSLLAAAFTSPTAAAPAAPAEPRYRGLGSGRYLALVIGNDRYAAYPELKTAAADAAAMSDLLQTHYDFDVTTLINADRYQIMSALSELRRTAEAEDSILLYYAGHGLLDEQADRGYWLPVDAERDNQALWISTADIAGVFAGASARHALVIADSCFAGTLLRSAEATGLETLKRLAAKRSRTVLTSGGLEPVVDDGDGTHSVFAASLLEALTDNDTVLEAGKLFAAVRDRVVKNADQTPQYSPMQKAGHAGGDFLFIPKTIRQAEGTD